VLEEALRAGASLATLSERGRIVPELSDPRVRELFVFKYRLMYRVEERRVVIVAFLHGRATSRRGGRLDRRTSAWKATGPVYMASSTGGSRSSYRD
jgi:hypothetical protein